MLQARRIVPQRLLATSDLILPMAWYLHPSHQPPLWRRPMPSAQLLAALVIAGLVALVNPGDIDNWINHMPALTLARHAGVRRFASCWPISSPSLLRCRARPALVDGAAVRQSFAAAWYSALSIIRPLSPAMRSPGRDPRWCISCCSSARAWLLLAPYGCCGPRCGHSKE